MFTAKTIKHDIPSIYLLYNATDADRQLPPKSLILQTYVQQARNILLERGGQNFTLLSQTA